jgi:hypothetical protein
VVPHLRQTSTETSLNRGPNVIGPAGQIGHGTSPVSGRWSLFWGTTRITLLSVGCRLIRPQVSPSSAGSAAGNTVTERKEYPASGWLERGRQQSFAVEWPLDVRRAAEVCESSPFHVGRRLWLSPRDVGVREPPRSTAWSV